MATVPAIPGREVPASSLPAVADPVGGESTHLELDNEQLGSESAQAGSPVVVGQRAGDINNESEGVGAETGEEGSSGAAWGGAKQAVSPGWLRPPGSKTWLPRPLPSSPRTLRSSAAKSVVAAVAVQVSAEAEEVVGQRTLRSRPAKVVVAAVADQVPVVTTKQTRRAAKKARQVLNRN